MKTATLTVVLAAAAIGAGCTTLSRSRDLGNPNVPAKTLAEQVCSNCHGVDGNSINPTFPKLAAQQDQYIEGQLKMFRSHHRDDPPGFEYMWGISRSLSDAQLEGLAKYFSSQKSASLGPGNPKLAAIGERIFHDGLPAKGVPPCASCHGDHGQGNGLFPRIAYQHSDYVIKQLAVFQRTNERPDGVIMKTITHSLDHENMEAVAAYLRGMTAK
jgi:cytochrome c553